ncbi:MAG: HAMP domain-containing protein [Nitrospiraceae bacterium]|nr:HAMP domain-containing protein [Nitrospiraceae bacterium]
MVGYAMRRLFAVAWLHRLTLGQKILATFSLLLLLLGLSLLAILFYASRINSYVERHTRITVPAITTAADMRRQLFEMNLALAALATPRSSNERAELTERIVGSESALHGALEIYRVTHAARTHPILFRMLTKHDRVDLADQEDRTLARIAALLKEVSSKDGILKTLLEQNKLQESDPYFKATVDLTRQLIEAVTTLMEVHTKIDAEIKSEGNSLLGQAGLVIVALVILLGLVIAATYAMVTTQIARPLSRLASAADRITHQDLSAGFDLWPAKDEVGILARSLSAMLATLRERTQALERKTRELESFTYSVAHDLKAPLREIEGFSSLLIKRFGGASATERVLDETALRYIDLSRTAALRMTAFIDDLLQYSRLEQQSPPKSRIDLRALLDPIIAKVTAPAEAPPRFSIQLPFTDVWGEPTSLRQALLNLLDNAVKFSRGADPGDIIIGGSAADGHRLLWIQDFGIGFDPKDSEKIFGLFERLHGPDEYEGTGAGLAIVKLVMDKHGGRVWAESSPGKGSTFYLMFPEP